VDIRAFTADDVCKLANNFLELLHNLGFGLSSEAA